MLNNDNNNKNNFGLKSSVLRWDFSNYFLVVLQVQYTKCLKQNIIEFHLQVSFNFFTGN